MVDDTLLNLERRREPYCYVTWIAPYLSGERQCMLYLHYKINYYTPKRESDLGAWVEEHARMVKQIAQEHSEYGGTITVERENYFAVKSRAVPNLMLGGQCDVVIGEDNGNTGDGLVVDAKTGQKRPKDRIQVMLYMSLLPAVNKIAHITKTPYGELVYKDSGSESIEPSAITVEFKEEVRKLLQAACNNKPVPTPSVSECRYCDLQRVCPHFIEASTEATEIDWL